LSQQLDRFSENLKAKLAEANSRLDNLKAKLGERRGRGRAHLDQKRHRPPLPRTGQPFPRGFGARLFQAHFFISACRGLDFGAVLFNALLHFAIDEAVWATLNAWLARQDVKSAQAKQAARRLALQTIWPYYVFFTRGRPSSYNASHSRN